MADDPAATVDPPAPPAPDDPAPTPEDTPLGPAGEKALEAFKERARNAEREAKELREKAKRAETAEARLAEIDEANKSEQEKAIEAARKEAAEQASKAAAVELRAERLSAAIAREAAKDFADVDDAIRLLDTDDDKLFDDDGRVQTDALKSALADLLEAKPHLKADDGRPGGGSGAGKGEGPPTSLDEMSVDDHLKLIRNSKN